MLFDFRAQIEDPRAKGAQKTFVPGTCEKVAWQFANIDGQVAGSLGGIDQKQRSRVACDFTHRGHGLYRAGDIRSMDQGNELRIRPQCLFDVGRVNEPSRIGAHARALNSQFAAQLGQRTQDRIVLDRRGDDMVAGFKQPVQRQVQAVGAVERENNAIGALGSQQLGDSFAAAMNVGGRLDGGTVRAAPDSGPVFAVVFFDGRVNGFRLGKTRRGVVEVNRQPPIEYIGRSG